MNMTRKDRALELACQRVLQTRGGTNPVATQKAHAAALEVLAKALGDWQTEKRGA